MRSVCYLYRCDRPVRGARRPDQAPGVRTPLLGNPTAPTHPAATPGRAPARNEANDPGVRPRETNPMAPQSPQPATLAHPGENEANSPHAGVQNEANGALGQP